MSEYRYEYEWDSEYCYPNSSVLKNKLDIHDNEILSQAERRLTSLNIMNMKEQPVPGKFDLKHLQAIHKAMFGDIYEWAGQLRTVDIAKGNQFCLCQYLESYAGEVFTKLKQEKYLRGKPLEEMSERLTFYLSEINVLHPFREGNGRAQRVFIEYLAKAAYHVDFSQVSGREMVEASVLSFGKDYSMMEEMFRRITTPVTVQERREFCRKIGITAQEQSR